MCKTNQNNDFIEVDYIIRRIKVFEEAFGLLVSINWEIWSKNVLRFNVEGNITHPSADIRNGPLLSIVMIDIIHFIWYDIIIGSLPLS